jgi:hypothetical protein
VATERLEFEAVVEAEGPGALVRLPADTAERFGTRARFPVRATFNGVAYRGSTMPTGDGTFCLGLTKAVRAAAGVAPDDPVQVTVERDTGERTVEVPADLAAALAGHPEGARRFEAMSYTHRREYVEWIESAKRADTRARRVAKAVAMIAGDQASYQ